MTKLVPVSVVIPCFNAGKTLERAVNSIAGQSYKPFQIIIVDDKSNDETVEVAKKLSAGYPGAIDIIELPINSGPSTARNKGCEAATGKYIAFLDADDSWHAEKIKVQYNFMEKNKAIFLSGHKYGQYRNDKIVCSSYKYKEISLKKLLLKNYFVTPTVMVRNGCNVRFDENKKYSEDYFCWLTIVAENKKAAVLNVVLAYGYKAPYGESGLSSNMRKMFDGEIDNYQKLHMEEHIRKSTLVLVKSWSSMKFVKRKIALFLRNKV